MRNCKKVVLSFLAVVFTILLTACNNMGMHTHSVELVDAKEPTCTEKGNISYYECKICKTAFSDKDCTDSLHFSLVEIPALGHEMVEHEAVEVTCTEAGSVHYYECTVCNKYFEDAEGNKELADVVVPSNGHAMVEHAAKEATCTEAGNIHYYECSACGKNFEDEKGSVELENVATATKDHTMTEHAAIDATCTEAGNVHYFACSECNKNFADAEGKEEIKDVVVSAKGHKMVEHVAKEATCTEAGNIHNFECMECHKHYEDANGSKELTEVAIPAKGHSMTEHAAKEATCTEVGNVHYFACSACNKNFADAEGKAEIKDVVVPAKGHSMTEHAAIDATCTEAGNVLYFTCSVCNKNFADAEGKTEIKDVVVPATGHSMTEHAAKEATCTEAGNVHYFACSACNKNFADAEGKTEVKDVVVPATGHSMTEHAAKDATCTEAGNVHYFACSACNKNFADAEGKEEVKDVVVPAKGHSLVEHPAVDATVDANGNIQYFECTECHKYYADADGLNEIAPESVVRYAYQVSGNNNKTPGYYVDYRESYTFTDEDNDGVFVSNNKGVSSSGAYMDIFFTESGYVTFTYEVSSESGWDKFNLYAKSDGEGYRNLVYNASGIASATLTLYVEAGDYVYFQYSKDSGGNKNEDCVKVSNIIFVTASEYQKVNVNFDTNGGSAIESQNIYAGTTATEPATPTKDEYFFDGWYADAALTTPFDFANVVNETVTVYAKYVAGVTVSFANTENTVVESLFVKPNTGLEVPAIIPTAEGKYFAGWFADAECTVAFDFAAGVTTDTVVYAGWRNPVELSFNSNGGSELENIATDINVAIEMPADPTRVNYKFAGWYTDAECTVAFDATLGITENTTVYAKWIAQVVITYMFNTNEIGTESVDMGTAYTATKPADFDEIVTGWFTDPELTNAYVDGTVLESSITLYAKIHQIAPDGVLESFVNGDNSSKTTRPWVYDAVNGTYTSSNAGEGSSKSIMTLTFAKQSFVSFDFLVNSECRYDYLLVTVNDNTVLSTKQSDNTYNGIDYVSSFTYTFNAGDEVVIVYTKDSSGNRGDDHVVISNLVIRDGIPSVELTFNYQKEGVENVSVPAQINQVIKSIENFASYAPVDEETVRFGGWYYDVECTLALGDDDTILDNTTLYAKYLYPATITFDTDGAGEIAPMSAWTGVAIELPANPTKAGYIFRYWLDENAEEFDPAKGITGDILLTAYFEELPVGSTKEQAYQVELTNGSFTSSTVRTNEEFQNFYFVINPTVSDVYYFGFDGTGIVLEGGNVKYTSYRRYTVVDSEGNTLIDLTSSDEKVTLEAGKTYYAIYNLGYNTNHAWGQFIVNINTFAQDSADEAVTYTFGQDVTIPTNTFASSKHEMVYAFTADVTGTFALKVQSNAWAAVYAYADAELSSQLTYKNVYNNAAVVDLTVVAGETYYIVVKQNWSGTGFANNTITFSVKEYQQGYTAENPFDYTLGSEVSTDFTNGANNYYQFTIEEAGTYKLSLVSLADSNNKTVKLFNINDLTTAIATIDSAAAAEKYIEELAAGTYVIKVYNTSSSYNASCSVKFEKVATGAYWSTAEEVVLGANNSLNALEAGYYYTFTTGEQLWYFFSTSANVMVYKADRTQVGSNAIQLDANTEYFLVVTSAQGVVDVLVETKESYSDGKSPAGAFEYTAETKNMSLEQGSQTWYYIFTATESGTYRFYSYNNGTIDTKGYVFSDPDYLTRIGYNDDGGNAKVTEGYIGYRYDFFLELDLVAGTTYYVKVTYTVYASNTADQLYLVIEK